jgi:hypothetical protein
MDDNPQHTPDTWPLRRIGRDEVVFRIKRHRFTGLCWS